MQNTTLLLAALILANILISIAIPLYLWRKQKAKLDRTIKDKTSVFNHGDAEATLTHNRMVNILDELNAAPEPLEDGNIRFIYQGEIFVMMNRSIYVRIWDLGWASVETDDPQLPIIREAVNQTNFQGGPTILMSAPNDEGSIIIHSRIDLPIPVTAKDTEIRKILKDTLNAFFGIKGELRDNISKQQDDQNKKFSMN